MANDLAAFLRARLDEDEQIARAAVGTEGETRSYTETTTPEAEREQAHSDRHGPARVLAEVDAKWCIIDQHQAAVKVLSTYADPKDAAYVAAELITLGKVLGLLALPYANHPDYRKEWCP